MKTQKTPLEPISAAEQRGSHADAENAANRPYARQDGKIIINTPCHLARAGKTRIVTPRRRIVQGGRWTVENGRRTYHVNTRWEVEYIVSYTDWQGIAHIVVATDFASGWELTPVGSIALEEVAA